MSAQPNMDRRRIKVGIDVGGTFTHAVAVDAASASVLGKAMVPTTHSAKEGVAMGVVQSLQKLIDSIGIDPSEVALIAHSTTQATNALLEGDVATVGILGMGKGGLKFRIKSQENVRDLELAPGKFLKTKFSFIDTSSCLNEVAVKAAAEELKNEGAEVFVTTESFGVDDSSNEETASKIIRDLGWYSTAASGISHLYGLKVRTQTAAVNASMLPKMLDAANMTESSVKSRGITSPLMIMRSDGGIMSVSEMRRRPILTMLSGPAAGVAAALMYVRVFDGIFLEVGGTSTDISIVRRGRPVLKTAEIGGRRVFLRTLDVRTIGVAGGSMIRISSGRVSDVGPRSAHIAGLKYVSFSEPGEFRNPKIHLVSPTSGDPGDYCAISPDGSDKPSYALTATDAANYLGIISGSHAGVNLENVRTVFEAIARMYSVDPQAFANEILEKATAKVIRVVRAFADEYKLDPSLLQLVGGGGAAEVIVPFTARKMRVNFAVAENPEVISAIGVALGLIQETVERNALQPSEGDIVSIRQEALDGVLRMGASPESAEVHVEIDQRSKKIVATAFGTPELRTRDLSANLIPEEGLKEIARKGLQAPDNHIRLIGETKHLCVYQAARKKKTMGGLTTKVSHPLMVVDRSGSIKLTLSGGEVIPTNTASIFDLLPKVIEEKSSYGDAGLLAPDVFVAVGAKVVDLTSLVDVNQILSVCRIELQRVPGTEKAILIITEKQL